MWFEEIKVKLIAEDEEFKKVYIQHKEYDDELRRISQQKYISPEDQLREVELKKKKLALKDKMLQMATSYKQKMES